jgi:hypothetical protein
VLHSRTLRVGQFSLGLLVLTLTTPASLIAADDSSVGTNAATAPSVAGASNHPDATSSALIQPHGWLFGIAAGDATIGGTGAVRVTTRQLFTTTASNTFQPAVFPFLGVTAGLRHATGTGTEYQQRYLTALADHAIGNFMTSAIAPALLRQDPRYVPSDRSGVLHRAGYALSRSVLTRSRSGRTLFNYSEIGGNAVAAGLSNLYYSPAERTVTGTLTRWGSQVMWNCLSNEIKEFWPDIRQRIRRL